jgi:hypothetical protein
MRCIGGTNVISLFNFWDSSKMCTQANISTAS